MIASNTPPNKAITTILKTQLLLSPFLHPPGPDFFHQDMSLEVFSGGGEVGLRVPERVRYAVEGVDVLGGGVSSIRRGRGMPRVSSAGGGVWGVDPKGGGGVLSNGDRAGFAPSPMTSVSSNPLAGSVDGSR